MPDDRWTQAALTVEGKIANLDVVYAGSYLKRDVDTEQDYSDYSLFYDITYGYTVYNDAGDDHRADAIHPGQGSLQASKPRAAAVDAQRTTRVRFVGGLFFQRQQHRIRAALQDRQSDAALYEVTDWPDSIWLTEQERVDRDYAVFGELSFDITGSLTLTGGARGSKPRIRSKASSALARVTAAAVAVARRCAAHVLRR